MTDRLFRFLGVVVSVVLASVVFVSAQDTRPAEQVYKNIKVMKGLPANQIIQGMHLIKSALGVDCTHCHIEMEWDRDDVQPMKDKARAMYTMVAEINRANFKGEQVVTCFTCHKGKAIPDTYPAMPVPSIKPESDQDTKIALPAVDLVLAKYVSALGGEQALRRITSRVVTGNLNIATGPGGTVPVPATLERSMKAPNFVFQWLRWDRCLGPWSERERQLTHTGGHRRRSCAPRGGILRTAYAETAVPDDYRRWHRAPQRPRGIRRHRHARGKYA